MPSCNEQNYEIKKKKWFAEDSLIFKSVKDKTWMSETINSFVRIQSLPTFLSAVQDEGG